ncbi:hypothetical protein BFJ68_g17133 [Fusarium oxysporum]|uniref:PiggyBac transposable element-derived protein domain-containing protein n=1 Tax=Fusarium oxysporum TaxID=5507 RepID=A0A420P1Y2_FUSOX|nr:hypothetical protein BFJ68_g17133 [Fusarium oxysporum]
MMTFLSSSNALIGGHSIFSLQQQSFVIQAHILPWMRASSDIPGGISKLPGPLYEVDLAPARSKYGPVGVSAKKPASQKGRRKGKGRGSRRRTSYEADEDEEIKEVIHVITEVGNKMMALNSTQSVVIALINLLPELTYHVFVDNLFSSSDLFLSLRQHGHGATGTARPNCSIYKGLADAKKADKAGKSGFQFNEIKVIPTADNQVNQMAWKDNALVFLLSTVFTGEERCDRWRKRPSTKTLMARPIQRFFSGEPVKLISIPTIAASYNDEMNHVDRGDQRRSYLGYDHPIRRGTWQAIAWTFLLDVVLVNSLPPAATRTASLEPLYKSEEVEGMHLQRGLSGLPSTEPVKAGISSRRRIYARGTT